jgi:DNA polymerase
MFIVPLRDETDFTGWRDAARRLALAGVPPEDVQFGAPGAAGSDLFQTGDPLPQPAAGAVLNVPRELVERLEHVIHHRDPDRFSFMYRLLLRASREKNLLRIASDPDIRRLEAMEKAIRRDAHKMHAFVRFKKIDVEGEERFVAWFEPEYYIVEREADFFVRRFAGMKWSILTPWRSISWDGAALSVGPGAAKADAPSEDAADDLWRTYYASIFNPARLKVRAMQAEMPKKYWRNLPEAELIPSLIAGAGKAAEKMMAEAPTLAAPHHARLQERYWTGRDDAMSDAEPETLKALARQAEGCTRCPLYKDATQTVFGEGPGKADLVFVGEQPGDQEDLAGKPFVGPAGRLLDEMLEEAGIDRTRTYVTNAVKHFKFVPRGKRRIHQKPNAGEIKACRWWLDHELGLIKPKMTVALGATALTALFGKSLPVTRNRGLVVTSATGLPIFVTVHPSFLLRIPDRDDAARERMLFAKDLAKLRDLAAA